MWGFCEGADYATVTAEVSWDVFPLIICPLQSKITKMLTYADTILDRAYYACTDLLHLQGLIQVHL